MPVRTLGAMALAFIVIMPMSASAATKIGDPAKFVAGVYARIAASRDFEPPSDIYTPRLAALFALDQKEAGGEVGRIDFDPWTNAQDQEVRNVKVTSQPVESAPSREIVVARFTNLGNPQEIHFYFEHTGAGWMLDDMRSASKERWTLSLVLKYGWDEAQ